MEKEKYEDYELLNQTQRIIALQKAGKLVVSRYGNYGIPKIEDLGVSESADYPGSYKIGKSGTLIYENNSGTYIYTPTKGEKQPEAVNNYKVLELAEAEYDTGKEMITIKHKDDLITYTGISGRDYRAILSEINKGLTKENVGLVVWRINVIVSATVNNHLFPHGNPRATNEETSLKVTGYAFDENNKALVYLGVVGYKTSIESLKATIGQGKPVSLRVPMEQLETLQPFGKYLKVIKPMSEYESHHCLIITSQAVEGNWEPDINEIYIAQFTYDKSIKDQIIDRLNEALVIPFLQEWAETIWNAGIDSGFIEEIKTGGDCLRCVKVKIKEDWQGLVEKLITSEAIAI
jgi:hypothetical protein